jgi:hypothetical protein
VPLTARVSFLSHLVSQVLSDLSLIRSRHLIALRLVLIITLCVYWRYTPISCVSPCIVRLASRISAYSRFSRVSLAFTLRLSLAFLTFIHITPSLAFSCRGLVQHSYLSSLTLFLLYTGVIHSVSSLGIFGSWFDLILDPLLHFHRMSQLC